MQFQSTSIFKVDAPLATIFAHIIRSINAYNTISEGLRQTQNISAQKLINTVNYVFAGISVLFTLLYGSVIIGHHADAKSVQTLLSGLAIGIIILACHVAIWVLFRRFLLSAGNDCTTAHSAKLNEGKPQQILNEMKYIFPAYAFTTFGSLGHILFIREHNIYMFCELLLFSGIWYHILRKNIAFPTKRVPRILYTIAVLIILFVILRFLFCS